MTFRIFIITGRISNDTIGGIRMNYISFPGLGIGPFHVDSTAFTVFGIKIAWYGIIICVGLILGVLYSIYRAKKNEGIKTDTVIDLAFFLVIFGVIGARLYYVIFKFGDYIVKNDDGSFNLGKTLLSMINIREGGLAIYGAIIAGFLTILVFAKIKKIGFLKILDFVSPAVMIGQIVGRWGNFFNMEAYGSETTLPWRMGLHFSNFRNPDISEIMARSVYVHPTFLYESLWNLIGFIIINIFYKKKKYDGQIFFMYIAWYGFGRFFVEWLRTDSLMLGVFRVSQIVGALTFICGVVLFILFYKKSKQNVAVTAGTESTLGLAPDVTGENKTDDSVIESGGEKDGEDN